MNRANTAPESPSTEIRRCGPAWHQMVAGLNVLRLKGSPYEMGRQHGALLRREVSAGPMPYYGSYVRKMLQHTGVGPLTPLVAAAIERGVGRKVMAALPQDARQTLTGLAEGAGLPLGQVLRGAVMPDSLMWAAATLMRVRRIGPAMHHRLALGLGCSSAMAWGDATADGRLLHARNMDYHGVDCWPRTAAVLFHEPEGEQRYVSVAAAGVPMGGITAMNEAGLTLAVHQHMFTHKTTLGGTPIGVVGDRIMRQAENLDQAEAILRSQRPIACWTYLVTDGNRREVLCFEENPFCQAARRVSADQGSRFGYANIYLDPELGATERELYGSYWRHNMGRQQTIDRRLAADGPLTPDRMAAIMGDQGQDRCRIARSLAMMMTVSSVVFRPDDGAFWVATGAAPVSSNPYVPFSLRQMGPAPELGQLHGGVPTDPDAAAAFELYRDAYLAYFERQDLGASLGLVRRAMELQPDQPLYHQVAGLLCLKRGAARQATQHLDRALELGHPDPEREAAFHLWRGRAADRQGLRQAALDDYRAALDRPADWTVHRAARAGLRHGFSRKGERRIAIDFAFADVMAP